MSNKKAEDLYSCLQYCRRAIYVLYLLVFIILGDVVPKDGSFPEKHKSVPLFLSLNFSIQASWVWTYTWHCPWPYILALATSLLFPAAAIKIVSHILFNSAL